MHTTSLIKRYIVVAAVTMVALAALAYALQTFVGINIGSAGGIVAAMVPAMDAGQAYAKRWGKRPENGFAWKLTAAFTALNFVISFALVGAMSAATGGFGDMTQMLGTVGLGTLAIILVVMFAVYWLAGRFFFGFGAKNQLKLEERLAAKK